MGLDAFVYCDCIEKKRLRIPHPFPRLLHIYPSGAPDIRSRDEAKIQLHDECVASRPCEHEDLMLAGCYLGNASSIELIRTVISAAERQPCRKHPVLWSKVIYCGTHTGDWLNLAEVRRLKAETS